MARRIALLQSGVEILSTPSTDLRDLVGQQQRWKVDLFTEASAERMIAAQSSYDCVVIAEDALIHDDRLVDLLSSLDSSHLVLLRQRESRSLRFIGIVEEHLIHETVESPQLEEVGLAGDEVLLHWPHDVDISRIVPTRVRYGIDTVSSGQLIPAVRAAGQRGACVLRTFKGSRFRRVVCTAPTPPNDPMCAQLVLNMIAYAAEGEPDIVLVHDTTSLSSEPIALSRLLALQGATMFRLDSQALTQEALERWPLIHASTMLCTRDVLDGLGGGPEALDAWLRRGTRLVLLEDDGSLAFRFGLSDPQWLANAWAGWFHSLEDSDWIGLPGGKPGSILRTRAILRVIQQIHDPATSPQPLQIFVEPPSHWATAVRDLVATRLLHHNDSIDNEVGISSAAIELLRIVGQDNCEESLRLRRWVTNELRTCALSDLPGAVSALGDRASVETAWSRISESSITIDPLRYVQLREASWRSGAPTPFTVEEAASEELRSSPLLAAEYLAAASADPSLLAGAQRLDDAIYALSRFGILRGGHEVRWPEPESRSIVPTCGEALALLRFFESSRHPAHPIVSNHVDTAGGRLTQLSRAVSTLRSELEAANAARSEDVATLSEMQQALRRSQHAVGVIFSALVGLIAFGLIARWTADFDVKLAVAAPVLVAVVIVVAVLHRYQMAPTWLVSIGKFVNRGGDRLRNSLDT